MLMVIPRNKADQWTCYVDTRRQLGELHREFGGEGLPLIRLFPPELPGAIEPCDGKWRIVASTTTEIRNCTSALGTALARLTAMMRSGLPAFDRAFHGKQLLDSSAIRWLMAAPNRYRAVLDTAGSQAMTCRHGVMVASPERMDGHSRVVVNIPGQKACIVTTTFRYERIR